MTSGSVLIGGLAVPDVLVTAIRSRRWPGEIVQADIEKVFGLPAPRPQFFDVVAMEAANVPWHAGPGVEYVGSPSATHPPGNLDTRVSLVIGELGPDQPVALDYRTQPAPQVVVATDDVGSPWRVVASSVDELIELLGWT